MTITSRIYWDTTCFISLLNANEISRAAACRDILMHAQSGALEIWTSTLAIAEVIRPRKRYEPKALPAWSAMLKQTDAKGTPLYPDAESELERIWHYYHRNTAPSEKLEPETLKKIKGMFSWDYIHLIQVTPAVAQHASDISRDTSLRPADAIHAASAISRKCSVLQRFDRHFDKVSHLIPVSEPSIITQPPPLFKNSEPLSLS